MPSSFKYPHWTFALKHAGLDNGIARARNHAWVMLNAMSCGGDKMPAADIDQHAGAERSSMGKSWCLGEKRLPPSRESRVACQTVAEAGNITREPSEAARSAPDS